MATKDGWNNKYTMTGVLNLDDGFIKIEREDDEPPVIIADDIACCDGKVVTISIICDEPR